MADSIEPNNFIREWDQMVRELSQKLRARLRLTSGMRDGGIVKRNFQELRAELYANHVCDVPTPWPDLEPEHVEYWVCMCGQVWNLNPSGGLL